jgi:hypothetical protein
MNMNINSNSGLPLPGIKVQDLPAFLAKIEDKNGKLPADDKKEILTFLTGADKNGNKDGFVTSAEVVSDPQYNLLNSNLRYSMEQITHEWAIMAGKTSGEELKVKLKEQEILDSIKVDYLSRGRMVGSLTGAAGKVELNGKKYDFALSDADDINKGEGLELALRNPDGNEIILGQEHIPQEFVDTVIAKKPPDSPGVRYSSIFNSRFCSVEK